jgi:hypothetical protein
MAATQTIHAVEMVRRIRDDLAHQLATKSADEIIAFYRNAGASAKKLAKSSRKPAARARRPTR